MVGAAFLARTGMHFLVPGLMMSWMCRQFLCSRFLASSSFGRQDRTRYLPSSRCRGSDWLQSTVTTSHTGLYTGFPGSSCLMMNALWLEVRIRFARSCSCFALVLS
jgi:hypothetical protein